MLNKVLRFLYYSLFLATPLIMLSSTSELFEFNKMLFIYLLALLVIFVWGLKMYREKRFFVRQTLLDVPILIFLAAQVLSTLFSIDRHTSLFGYYGRFNGGLLSTFAYLILFYGFITLFDKEYREKLLKWSLLSSFLVILWGLPGRFGRDLSCLVYSGQFNNTCWTDQFRPAERMFSTLGQPNWLGAYLAINFFIGLYFFVRNLTEDKNLRQKVIYISYLVLNFSGILFSRSRSALAAVAVGFILFFVLVYFNKQGRKTIQHSLKWLGGLALLLLLAILIFKTGIDKIDNFIAWKKIAGTTNQAVIAAQPQLSSEITESLDIRKIVWKGAIELGLRYPIFGTGVETFAYSYYFVRPVEHNLTSEWDYLYNKAHNEYLNYLATTGFVGLLTYLLVLGVVIFALVKTIFDHKEDDYLLAIALFSSYITILITNFFGFSTTTINLFFFILIPGVVVAKDSLFEIGLSKKFSLYGFFVVDLILLYFLVSLVLYFVADTYYAAGSNYAKINDYQTAVSDLNVALRLHYEPIYQDKYSYYLANLAFIAAYQKQNTLVARLVQLSTYYNQQTLDESPQNVAYWKTKAKNDYLFYQIQLDQRHLVDGVYALSQAYKLSPTDPKIPYSLAIYYSLLNDEYASSKQPADQDKVLRYKMLSLKNIDQAITLKKDYRDAYLLQAQLEKKYGEVDKARQSLEFILNNLSPQDKEASDELQKL